MIKFRLYVSSEKYVDIGLNQAIKIMRVMGLRIRTINDTRVVTSINGDFLHVGTINAGSNIH